MSDEPVPAAITLDERIDAILKTRDQRTIANMTRDEITARIEEIRKERAAKNQTTLTETGTVLKKCGKTKARKRAHTHVCEACGAEYDCVIGEGCRWAKRTPACGACMPDCTADFVETWTEQETENADK